MHVFGWWHSAPYPPITPRPVPGTPNLAMNQASSASMYATGAFATIVEKT